MIAGRLRELFERIEHSKSRTPEIPIVTSGDGQSMPPGGGRDITVFNGHPLTGFVEQPLLVSPHMRDGDIEAVNSTVKRVYQPHEPCLKSLTGPALLGAHPVS